jgi:hypothetical protein
MELSICTVSSVLSNLRLEFEFSFANSGAATAKNGPD